MTRARGIGLMVLTAAVIFFALQNLRSVEVVFLFWHFQAPVALLALLPMLAGLLVATAGTAIMIKQRGHRAKGVSDREAQPALEAQEGEAPGEAGAEIKDEEEILE